MKLSFSTIIGLIRSGVIWLSVGLVTFFFFFIFLIDFLVVYPFDRDRKALHALSSAWARAILLVCPVMRVHVELESKLNRRKPYIFVANHQSLVDILVVLHVNQPFKFVAKQELFWIPIFGWGLWLAGYIPLMRGDHKSGKETLERCRAYLRRGVSVLLFPEGTRSRNGEIQAFKVGAFKLSVDLNIPVVPVTIDGTDNLLPKGSRSFRKRSEVTAYVGKPRLAPVVKGAGSAQLFVEEVRQEMVQRLRAMRADKKRGVAAKGFSDR